MAAQFLGDGSPIPVMNGNCFCLTNSWCRVPSPATKTQAQLPAKIVHTLSLPGQSSAFPEKHQVSTVLVVDDSTTIRQALVTTLQKAGYQVLQARDGWEAVVQLRQGANVQLVYLRYRNAQHEWI